MSELNYDTLPEASFGKVFIGEIHGTDVRLSWHLDGDGVDELELVIIRRARAAQRIPLDPKGTGDGVTETTVAFDAELDITTMLVLARSGEQWSCLPHAPETYFLNRLLSSNLAEVNRNLRWWGRIPDLDTRFFAAKNTISNSPDDYVMHARCLVAVGYHAIEQSHNDKVEWALRFCQDNIKNLLDNQDSEIKTSIIIFWLHLVIYYEDYVKFLELAEVANDNFVYLENSPPCVFNAFHFLILIGGFFLNAKEKDKAVKFFCRFEKYLKCAAAALPNNLVNYREFVKISRMAYICNIGHEMSLERKLQADGNFPKITAELAWDEGNRIYNQESRNQMKEKYLRTIRAYIASKQ